MALFKIFKGQSSDLQSNKTNAVEGYVYYTTDESKFYIDIATAATAVIGENRMPLNAYKADTLSQTLPISLGGTGATTASEALKALFENQTLGTINQPVYLSAGTITAGSTYAGGTLVNLNGSNMGATAVNIYAATNSGTSGQFLISNGENSTPTWVSNITVPGTLNVIGQTTLNNNVTVDGQITTNELIIQGQGSAQTPTAAQHIATKGYVDNAISQGTAAQVGAILTIGSYTYNGSTAINIPIYDGTYS